MDSVVNMLGGFLGQAVARIVVALLVLVIGWLIARFIANLVGRLLVRLGVDKRMNKATEGSGTTVSISKVVGQVVFWFVMLIVLAQVFLLLNLTVVSDAIHQLPQFCYRLPAFPGGGGRAGNRRLAGSQSAEVACLQGPSCSRG